MPASCSAHSHMAHLGILAGGQALAVNPDAGSSNPPSPSQAPKGGPGEVVPLVTIQLEVCLVKGLRTKTVATLRLWHAEDFFPSKRIAICTQTQAASETAAGLVSKVCIGNGRRLPGLCTTGLRLKDEVGGRGATSCNVAHAHRVFRTSRLCSEALGTPTECLALDLQKAGTSIGPNRQNPGSLLKTQNKGNTHTHALLQRSRLSTPRSA